MSDNEKDIVNMSETASSYSRVDQLCVSVCMHPTRRFFAACIMSQHLCGPRVYDLKRVKPFVRCLRDVLHLRMKFKLPTESNNTD